MSNPTPILNNINAFDATKGTTISFNIIGGTDIVRSNIVYIYDLSTNDLICTHLYISTESIHELPPNTDSSIVYASGKSSADFVNNKNYYLQIQTFTNTAGTAGGSGMSVAKTFWCLFDPALSVNAIPAAISTTSYNVGATYTTNITDVTIPVTNIIQQYKFDLYTATGTLVQTSGNIIGSGEQEGTSTTYNITYNFSGLVVNNSYYVIVTTTSTEGMTVSAQSNTFAVSIDTPTVGGAIVNNNACDGYISVVSNLSDEYGGSASGEMASFETDSVNNVSSLKVNMEPIQDLHGYDKPWVGGAGKNKLNASSGSGTTSGVTFTNTNGIITASGTATATVYRQVGKFFAESGVQYIMTGCPSDGAPNKYRMTLLGYGYDYGSGYSFTGDGASHNVTCDIYPAAGAVNVIFTPMIRLASVSDATYAPYSNICPISGHDEVDVVRTGKNLLKPYVRTGTTYGLSYSINEDGSVTLNGTTTGIVYINIDWVNNTIHPYDLTNFVGQTMYASLTPSLIDRGVGNLDITAYKEDGTQVNLKSRVDNGDTFVVPSTAKWGRSYIAVQNGVTFNNETFYPLICIDSSSDRSWEPYTEETFHQDIEATYTPTVQENEPYLFKQTGDVGGDRETIELVGGTVAWNQLVGVSDIPSKTSGGITGTNTRDIFSGTVDLVTGVLTVDKAMVDLGTLNWTYDNTSYAYSFFTSTAIGTRKGGSLGDVLCSQYTINQGGRYSLGSGTGQIASYNEGATTTSVCVRDDNYTDATAFKTAMNGVQLVYELATPQTYQLTPQQINTLVGTNNVWSEQGDVELAYHIPITDLLVKRQDVDDVSGNWLTLYSQPVEQASDMDFTFIDFLNQYGKTYRYALVPLLTQQQGDIDVEIEGGYTVSDDVLSVFDGVFVANSNGSQKLKASTEYGDLETNQDVGVLTTIGNKYPFVVSNSNLNYHSGSISALIVPSDFYTNGDLDRLSIVERREAIEQFLTDKTAKILKDWNGNIWLITFVENVEVSFVDDYGMGLGTLSAKWVEIGDVNDQTDLKQTGLI